jgi:hypothetical protein
MRKYILIHTIIFGLILTLSHSFCFAKNVPSFDGKGYVGTLPDLNRGYEVKETKKTPPEVKPSKDFNSENELKPVPRDNPAFVNIILKPDKTSQYVNDLNEIIPLLEDISSLIEDNASVQLFNAKVYYFNKSAEFLRDKYKNKPESQFVSFKKLMELNTHTKSIALLRNEAVKYNPYLAYGSAGYIYNPNNLSEQMDFLKSEIQQTILILRDSN